MSYGRDGGGWDPYVRVADRLKNGKRKAAAFAKRLGRDLSPVVVEGRKIAKSFWGDAWCRTLESYGDYANRLPRGRTYVRNGSVVDLEIAPGAIKARVAGSDLYKVEIAIKPASKERWRAIREACAGKIDSMVALLRGELSGPVMEVVTRASAGLFPAPAEIHWSCSCPDSAYLCKHVAAVLYGVGARLDETPEILFRLRDVDPAELVEVALAPALSRSRKKKTPKQLAGANLSEVFGIDLESGPHTAVQIRRRRR